MFQFYLSDLPTQMKSTRFLLFSYSFITKISFVLKEVSFPDLNSYAASCFVFTICGRVPKHYNNFHWIQLYYICKNLGKQAQRKQTKVGSVPICTSCIHCSAAPSHCYAVEPQWLQSNSTYTTISRTQYCLLVASTGVCIQSKMQKH